MVKIILTHHLVSRAYERNIDIAMIIQIAKNSRLVKINTDDTIGATGKDYASRSITVVYIKRNNTIIIKTAYYENNL